MHDSLYLFKRGPLALGHEPGVFKRPSNQLITTNDVEAGPAQYLDFVKRQGDIGSECIVHYATGMGVGLFVPKGSLIDRHAFDNSAHMGTCLITIASSISRCRKFRK